MKNFLTRNWDSFIYILHALCTVLLIVATIQLQYEVRVIDKKLDNNQVRSASEIRVTETSYVSKTKIIDEVMDHIESSSQLETAKLYSDEDATVLAKMLWGEARGVSALNVSGKTVSSKCQQAAVIWTVLNRYDNGYANSISKVVTAPNQFVGYKESNPIDDELMDLVIDVLERWNREKQGDTNVGRVLPSNYMWFHGDGRYNHFRDAYTNGSRWTWDLEDPYI